MSADLYSFVRESNRIEAIVRDPTDREVEAHEMFISLPYPRLADVENFVNAVAGAPLRNQFGMNVFVGDHPPPPGGPKIEEALINLLEWAGSSSAAKPWEVHVAYEKLHPFMDGNGRSGRALWAWMRWEEDRDPFVLGFLHSAYYEALEASRQDTSSKEETEK